jgi:2-oxoglutarate ferredoxin oxidoreductase subunit alpha
MVDVTLTVAGMAGQGVKSAGAILTRLLARDGYHVFAYPDVMSRVRGGHNFTDIRVADHPVQSARTMIPGGTVVFDGEGGEDLRGQVQLLRVPFGKLAREHGGSPVYGNAVALGVMVALIGQPRSGLEALLRERFRHRGRKVVGANLKCARAGYARVSGRVRNECPCRIPVLGREPKLVLTGNQAAGFGALAAGVRLYAGYPMSPATGIMEYLAGKQRDFGLVMEQAEDEIGAANIALGAAYAGARAMTATSGGGFALMVEALGFAGMAELPLVIVVAQRPGPATGFPTRTEQGELLYVLNAGQDEFPRFVFAPGNAEQMCYATHRAFELASRFQVPAIVLSDQQLADSAWTVDGFDRSRLATTDDFTEDVGLAEFTYQRYEFTDSGVSPRIQPGTPGQVVRMMGSEHDERGLPTEDAANRTRMHEKRMRKTGAMRECFGEIELYPDDGERMLVVCFGSTRGAVREAVDILQQDGVRVGMMHLPELWPFPRARVQARLAATRRLITVENNSTGQLGRLLARMTRRAPDREVLKSDGRPFSGAKLAEQLRDLL